MKEGFVETFLYHVFGILPVVGYSLRHGKNFGFVTNDQLLEGMGLSALCRRHQCVVCFLDHAGCTNAFHRCDTSSRIRHIDFEEMQSPGQRLHAAKTARKWLPDQEDGSVRRCSGITSHNAS